MAEKQLLHMVLGGHVTDPQSHEFDDLDAVDIVGLYPNYASAEKAWRAVSQQHVDDAMRRYFIVHMHRLMDPDE